MRQLPTIAAEPGRIIGSPDNPLEPVMLALFEAPTELRQNPEPLLLLAASSPGPSWRRYGVEIRHAEQSYAMRTSGRRSVLGRAAAGIEATADCCEVMLHDPEQWLTSCTDEDLRSGANLALLGREVIQFGRCTPKGGGRFELGRLARGRLGTSGIEHPRSVPFVLLDRGSLEPVRLPVWVPGETVEATIPGTEARTVLTPTIAGQDPVFTKY
jgi:hypothetical protein